MLLCSSKLSLSTPAIPPASSASNNHNDHPTRNYTPGRRYGGDSSSHGGTPSHGGKSSPFSSLPSSTSPAVASPTGGASSAFGLGTGAFASFGASVKTPTPKTPGGALDFGSVVSGTKTAAGSDKGAKESVSKPSSVTSSKEKGAQQQPAAHALKNSWVFWFRPPISKANGYVEYEKTLHPMAAFGTAEDFFTIYSHLKRPSSLPLVSDYHIFKKGIRPVWEDEENKKGGKWIVRLKKGVADRYWEDLLFAIIGDQFADAGDEVCGAVLSVRNGEDILSIWARNDGGRVLRIRYVAVICPLRVLAN